jgi:hypothetical protein
MLRTTIRPLFFRWPHEQKDLGETHRFTSLFWQLYSLSSIYYLVVVIMADQRTSSEKEPPKYNFYLNLEGEILETCIKCLETSIIAPSDLQCIIFKGQ